MRGFQKLVHRKDKKPDSVENMSESDLEQPTVSTESVPQTSSFPDGLDVFHDCPDATLDVCFVHGLTGNRETTWTAKGSSIPWPKTLLPACLDTARILTYGYDAYVVRKNVASVNRLLDHATNLLNDLVIDRASCNASSRPLILVAHSLGGLICKKAVLLSRTNPEPHLEAIFDSVVGIIFLGTPHRGSWIADWATIPASALGLMKSTNKSLLRILETSDQFLESIQVDFWSMVRGLREGGRRRFEVTCFFEELPLPLVGTVVSKDSATIEGYNSFSIHANHRDMTKFTSAEDTGFKRLRGELVRWEGQISKPPIRALNDQEIEFLDSLDGSDPDQYTAKISSPFENTFDWILSHNKFLQWLSSCQNQFLHVTGPLGSGKSVLSAFIFNKGLTATKRVAFYFTFGDNYDLHSTSNAWSAYIHQQLSGNPRLFSRLYQKLKAHGNIIAPRWTRSGGDLELKQTFELLATSFACPTFYVLDALDQCADGTDSLLQSFSKVMRKDPQVKLLILTRQNPRLIQPFYFANPLQLDLGSAKEHLDSIHSFIHAKTTDLCTRRPGLRSFQVAIYNHLCHEAGSMYLLPLLTINALLVMNSTPNDIRKALSSLPTDLESAYGRIIDYIPNEDWRTATDILTCVAFARRPLSTDELAVAVALPSAPTLSDLRETTSIDIIGDRSVTKLLGPILKITNDGKGDKIQLVHVSARRFVLDSMYRVTGSRGRQETVGRRSDQQDNSPRKGGHSFFANICMHYLYMVSPKAVGLVKQRSNLSVRFALLSGKQISENHFGSFEELYQEHPLLKYCVENLPEHAREVTNTEEFAPFFNEFNMFLACNSGRIWEVMFWSLRDPWQQYMGHHPLHMACLLGLTTTIQWLLKRNTSTETRNGYQDTAIEVAASTGRKEIVELLCTVGKADVNAIQRLGGTALHTAAFYGYSEVVRYLLSVKADSSIVDNEGCRPIERAAEAGSNSVISIFLEHGDSLERASGSWTAAHAAASAGRHEALEFLHTHHFDWMSRSRGMTPFHFAALGSRTTCVEYMISIMAGVSATVLGGPNAGCHALHLAAGVGSDAVVKLLLGKTTVDINATDDIGRTALHHATSNSYGNIAKILIDFGISTSICDTSGLTAIENLVALNQLHTDYMFNSTKRPSFTSDSDDSDEDLPIIRQSKPQGPDVTLQNMLNLGFDATSRNSSGQNLLHIAAGVGGSPLRTLLDHFTDIALYQIDNEGNTALHIAANRNLANSRLLLERFHDLEMPNHKGQTALHCFLQSIRKSTFFDKGKKPLYSRDINRKEALVSLDKFLEKMANLELEDNNGLTATCSYCKLLLSEQDSDENAKLEEERSFSFFRTNSKKCRRFYADGILKRLLNRGANIGCQDQEFSVKLLNRLITYNLPKDANALLKKMGTFELDGLITIDTSHYDIGEILVFLADHEYQRDALVAKVKAIGGKAMCRILADFIQQDEDGSATTLLALMGELDMHDFADLEDRARILLYLGSVEYPPERLEAIIQKLDEEELSLVFRRSGNLQNCSRKRKEFLDSCARIHGSTLVKMHHEVIFPAASNGDRLTLEFFFERCNVSTEVTDKQFHQTALSHAAEHGSLGVVKYLLGIGASVQSRDKEGRTALWWAAREGKTEVVKELLLSDAVIEADMIETCSKYGHHDIAQLLSQASSNTSSEQESRLSMP